MRAAGVNVAVKPLGLLLLLWFMGCSFVPSYKPTDGAPARSIDVTSIPDALPKPVVRTRAGNPPTYRVLGKTYRVMADSAGYEARGKASWYGTKFHGRLTSNGEKYDMFAMTAAHKTLPIPSYVRVTGLSSGRSIVVRINDRGPFKDGRLIDLSYAAAKKLGIDRDGVAWVDVVDVTPTVDQYYASTSTPAPSQGSPAAVVSAQGQPSQPLASIVQTGQTSGLYLQLGAFELREMAASLQNQVQSILVAPVNVIEGQDSLLRVALGPSDSRELLLAWQRILRANGLVTGFIVEL